MNQKTLDFLDSSFDNSNEENDSQISLANSPNRNGFDSNYLTTDSIQ